MLVRRNSITTSLTERDKKLLMILAVVLIVFLLGWCTIRPLLNTSKELSGQIEAAQVEKEQKEMKVQMLPVLLLQEEDMQTTLKELQGQFYNEMSSAQIDRELTMRALECGVQVDSLQIFMPDYTEYATVRSFQEIVNSHQLENGNLQGESFPGVYEARVQMALSGNHTDLQKFVDDTIQLEPKQHLKQITWMQQNGNGMENHSTDGLSLTISLYMSEDVDAYIQKKLEGVVQEIGNTDGGDTASVTESLP